MSRRFTTIYEISRVQKARDERKSATAGYLEACKKRCYVHFSRSQLKEFWTEFSMKKFGGTFILPDYAIIEDFIMWLIKYEY